MSDSSFSSIGLLSLKKINGLAQGGSGSQTGDVSPRFNGRGSKRSPIMHVFRFERCIKLAKLLVRLVIVIISLPVRVLRSWGELKRKLMKMLFLGRGYYYRYISHFLLMLIVLFGSAVYLFSDDSFVSFVSRYEALDEAYASFIVQPGMQSFVTQRQFRVTQYVVQNGDTLSSIAAKYSTEDNVITVDSIMWANNLGSDARLVPGMKLDIPPVSGVLHIVQKGDTVEKIAKEYGLLDDKSSSDKVMGVMQSIVDINGLNIRVEEVGGKEVRVPEIFEGQRLIIPGGIKKSAVPNVASTGNRLVPRRAPDYRIYDPGPPGFLWPVANGLGVITQGPRPGHIAVDIAHPSGPDLLSMEDGYIKYFSYFDGYWSRNCATSIVIAYDNGYESVYCHLRYIQPGLTVGKRVYKGQVVGKMGCTGLCTGTHLHLEIRRTDTKRIVHPCSLDLFADKEICR